MTDSKDIQTVPTEVLPVVSTDRPITVLDRPQSVESVQEALAIVDEIKNKIMKPGVDYMVIPGTPKPSLVQPGAEKLCFAFNLSPRFDIVEQLDDPERTWKYETTVWEGESGHKKPVAVEKTAHGYHRILIKCSLFTRANNTFIGEALGDCESTERGRETSPRNTIIAMAQKRAFVNATRRATYSSDRFTGDLEDFPELVAEQRKSAKPASDKQIGLLRSLANSSKVPDDLKKAAEKYLNDDVQPSRECSALIEKLKAAVEGGGSNGANQKRPEQGNAASGGGTSPYDIATQLEKQLLEGGRTQADIDALRKEHLNADDLTSAGPMTVRKYNDVLTALLKGSKPAADSGSKPTTTQQKPAAQPVPADPRETEPATKDQLDEIEFLMARVTLTPDQLQRIRVWQRLYTKLKYDADRWLTILRQANGGQAKPPAAAAAETPPASNRKSTGGPMSSPQATFLKSLLDERQVPEQDRHDIEKFLAGVEEQPTSDVADWWVKRLSQYDRKSNRIDGAVRTGKPANNARPTNGSGKPDLSHLTDKDLVDESLRLNRELLDAGTDAEELARLLRTRAGTKSTKDLAKRPRHTLENYYNELVKRTLPQ